jgi:hypothetical protein
MLSSFLQLASDDEALIPDVVLARALDLMPVSE